MRAEDLTVVEKDIQKNTFGYLTDPQAVLGMVTRSPMPGGATLTEHDIVPPLVLRKGEPVTIVAKIKGLTVTMQGLALENAAKGQLVEVKNLGSGKTVRGQALARTKF